MSAVFNVSGAGLSQGSNIAANSSSTQLCWARFTALPGVAPDYITLFIRANAGYTAWAGIFPYESAGQLFVELNASDGISVGTVDDDVPLNEWHYIGYVKSGNTHRLYIDGVLIGQFTLNINAVTFTDMFAGYDGFSQPGLEIAYFREWNAVLSSPEVVLEMNSAVPIRTANLITDTPLASDLLDDSGNGNNWSAVGGQTFGTSIAIPASASSVGAIDISSLPFNQTIDMVVDGFPFDVWFKHTGGSDYNLGIWGFGDLVSFSPRVFVYEDDAETRFPQVGSVDAVNIPLQIPFEAAITRYFRFQPNGFVGASAPLIVNAQRSPNETIPLGSICVPDDHAVTPAGFKLGIFSAIDGDDYHVLNFKNFPAGESGDILDNGMILMADEDDNSIKGFNADYSHAFTIASRPMASTFGCIRQCRGTQRWWILYINGGTTYRVKFITDAGVEGPDHQVSTVASAEDPYCLAVNNDESILYYGEATAGGDSIKSFNLATNTLIGTFATAPGANYKVADLLVLSDGSIVAYWASIVDDNILVRQYNAAGTILTTKDLGNGFVYPSSIRGRMAYSLDDPDTVWVWVHPALPMPGTSKFMEIELATGNILKTILQQEYEIGEYNSAANATPERFGASFSCPFWVATTGDAPVTTGTLVIGKLTDPFNDVIIWTVDAGGGLSPIQFTLVSDGPEQIYTDVPVGIYSIVEQAVLGWFTTYFVSNDVNNNNLAISVGPGETVTVIILNQARNPGSGIFTSVPGGDGGGGGSKPNDDFLNGDGTISETPIPNPFFITGFIRDA